ncbi:MAG: hypothetical protein UU08_C0026G0009 [Candidatus Uhrbacteria bacterium GW2011_GWE2_40_58]|nr:MAG: hypothetical protein UT94_C0035G0002 [Candidatus Uhrbacteria bacterium GW2011_GWF2_40_263]KKR67119.1 MAG: hypothetical protein UU08_C0026G0009 [Candidatus Uhrbacteria bacterium GW2011_GWE2_40_58]HCB56315.1 hypothetical protein [Candidatus Uhrbacteria bacterium]
MLVRKILHKQLPKGKEGDVAILGILLGIIFVVAVVVKMIQVFTPPSTTPLLAQKEGLVRAQTMEEISNYTQTQIALPEDLFSSELSVMGVYTQDQDQFVKEGTVVLVLARNGSRFVQISFQPNLTMEEQMNRYTLLPLEEILIGKEAGYFITLEKSFLECADNPEGIPDVCTFSKALTFTAGQSIVTISVDGGHASDGEVIAMARSIEGQMSQKIDDSEE